LLLILLTNAHRPGAHNRLRSLPPVMKHTSRSIWSLVVLVTLWSTSPVFGQSIQSLASADGVDAKAGSDTRQATVIVDGQPLFVVRGVSAYPAVRRAGEIADRIRSVAANKAIATSSMTVEDQSGATWILAGGSRIMAVTDEDASLESANRRLMAQVFSAKIAEAIDAYRKDREPAVLLRHGLFAFGATLVLLGAIYLVVRIGRRLQEGVERKYRGRIHDLTIVSFPIVKAEHVWQLFSGLLRFAAGIAILVMALVHLRYTLGLFPWTRGTATQLFAIAIEPLRQMVLALAWIVPDVAFLACLFVVTRYVLKLVALFFDSVATGRVKLQHFDAEWALPTYRLVRVLIVAFALVVAYPYIPGSETDAFKGISVFIGVVISLGSSSLIGNLIAGYSMTYRRAFKLGDRVKIGEHVGEVIEMRLLATHLRTPKNEEVIIPNATSVTSDVVNFSTMARNRGLILHTTVGVGYETPWRQVEAMLLEAASRTPGLLPDHPPFVLQLALATFNVVYELNVYSNRAERVRLLYSELHRNILDVFNEYGVQIMTPAYEGDPRDSKVVPKERWYAPPARPPAAPGRPLLVPKASS
jgi:small-conductance mechanosensitive channel